MSTNPNTVPTPSAATPPVADGAGTGAAAQPPAAAAPATPPVDPAKPAEKPPEPEAPKADPKAARLLLKQQEAERALHAERAALAKEREKIATQAKADADEFKRDPLAYAQKHGITYEDMTKRLIENASAATPEGRIKAVEEQLAAERKAAQEREQAAQKQQVQQRISTYIDGIHGHAKAGGEKFACINALEESYAKELFYDVADLMARERQSKGDTALPTPDEVCGKIEDYLEDQAERLYTAKSSKKKPAAPAAPPPNGVAAAAAAGEPIENEAVKAAVDRFKRQNAPKGPRTITNKVAAAPAPAAPPARKMTPKEAIEHVARLAAEGKLT